MKLTSMAFNHNGAIPPRYTCSGEDINPPLQIEDVPSEAKSLALIMDDPDSPSGTANPGWVHWVAFNISSTTTAIAEKSVPGGTVEGQTDFGKTGYGGPCPSSGTHRYFFRLYALDTKLNLDTNATKADVLDGANGHILDQTELMVTYVKTQ